MDIFCLFLYEVTFFQRQNCQGITQNKTNRIEIIIIINIEKSCKVQELKN